MIVSRIQTVFAIENSALVDFEVPNNLVVSENINRDHGKRDPSDTSTPAIEPEFNVGFITAFSDRQAHVCFVRSWIANLYVTTAANEQGAARMADGRIV